MKPEELALHDGKAGPAHVACGGKVYDVSASRLWKGGLHARIHQAGRDLTAEIATAPHGLEVLERVREAGVLEPAPRASERVPPWLDRLLRRFPVLQRHPHPALVHFPIALFIAAAGFLLLRLSGGGPAYATTALHCLGGGLLMTPPAMLSGLFTWWLNYEARPMRQVTLKIVLSVLLLLLAAAAFTLRVGGGPGGALYPLLVLLLVPLTAALGWIGGTLTFPLSRK